MEARRIDLGSQPLNSLKASKQARRLQKERVKQPRCLQQTRRESGGEEISAEDQETEAIAQRREGRVSASPGSDSAERELTSHGSLWEAGNPDCWSGGVISFHMSLPGKDGQEPASLSQE